MSCLHLVYHLSIFCTHEGDASLTLQDSVLLLLVCAYLEERKDVPHLFLEPAVHHSIRFIKANVPAHHEVCSQQRL